MSDFGPPPPPHGDPHDPHQPYAGQPGGSSYPGPPYAGQYPGPGRHSQQPYPGQYAGQPSYPGRPPAPQAPYYGGAVPPAQPSRVAGFGARMGDRLVRRPEPRFTVGLAGTGVALVLFGILLWGGQYWSRGLSHGLSTNRNLFGAALAAVITVAGYVLVIAARRGTLATAGVVAVGIGWPLTMLFLTLDVTSGPFPVNIDAVFWVSALAWLVTYVWVPGARGHTFFVFLVAQGFYTYVVVKNVSHSTFNVTGSSTGLVPRVHGVGTVAAISFFFGLGYYVIAFALDRRGKHGPATAFVYPAFSALTGGIVIWTPDIHARGAGALAIVAGTAVCWYGGRYGRRFTCFAGAAGVAAGVFVLLADATSDATTAGVSFIVIGVVIVFVATVFAMGAREPHDMDAQAVVRSR